MKIICLPYLFIFNFELYRAFRDIENKYVCVDALTSALMFLADAVKNNDYEIDLLYYIIDIEDYLLYNNLNEMPVIVGNWLRILLGTE